MLRRDDEGAEPVGLRVVDVPEGRGPSARRLVPLGRGGIPQGEGTRPADPPGHRGHLVPLVPRDRPRIVRGSGARRRHQRSLHRSQGGPRRATGHRRAVPAGRRRDRRPRRLAPHRLPDAGRQGVLRRHLFSTEGFLRTAELPTRPARDGGCLPHEQGRHAARGGGAPPSPGGRPRLPRRRRRRERGDAEGEPRLAPRAIRSRERRHLGPAEVPAPGDDGVGHGPFPSDEGRGPPEDLHPHAHVDGTGWRLRSGRRRLPSVLDGSAMDRAALREDAVRQRGPPGELRPRVATHSRPALPGDRRRDPLLGGRGPVGPPAWRILCESRRGRRPRRRWRLLHLDLGRTQGRGDGGRGSGPRVALRSRRSGRDASQPEEKRPVCGPRPGGNCQGTPPLGRSRPGFDHQRHGEAESRAGETSDAGGRPDDLRFLERDDDRGGLGCRDGFLARGHPRVWPPIPWAGALPGVVSPSAGATAVARLSVARLHGLPGNDAYRLPHEGLMPAFAGQASRYGPVFAGTYHLAAELWIHPPAEVVVLGPHNDPRVRKLRETASATYSAGKTVLVVDRDDAYVPPPVEPMLKTKEAKTGPVAFVCQGQVCSPPTSDPTRLRTILEAGGTKS